MAEFARAAFAAGCIGLRIVKVSILEEANEKTTLFLVRVVGLFRSRLLLLRCNFQRYIRLSTILLCRFALIGHLTSPRPGPLWHRHFWNVLLTVLLLQAIRDNAHCLGISDLLGSRIGRASLLLTLSPWPCRHCLHQLSYILELRAHGGSIISDRMLRSGIGGGSSFVDKLEG